MLTNEDLEKIRQVVREEIENRHNAQHEAYREGVKASFFAPVGDEKLPSDEFVKQKPKAGRR